MLRVKPIKDFENYTIREDGKVFNIHGNPVKLTPSKTNNSIMIYQIFVGFRIWKILKM